MTKKCSQNQSLSNLIKYVDGKNMMVFPRRRLLWLKASILGTAVWLTLCFLLYTEDQTPISTQALVMSDSPYQQQVTDDIINSELSNTYQDNNNQRVHRAMDNISGPEQGDGVLAAPKEQEPGNLGKPVVLPINLSPEIKKIVDDGWIKNAFNQYVSDLISVHRTLPDPRDEWCKEKGRYQDDLPATSVIICFHNEAWSVLLRTVHSVLNRSPEHLIYEILLVDDFSDMPHLKQQLADYIVSYPKVKIVRAKKREGLIRARLLGAAAAKAPVLTFLDSHCECTEGWLEPLMDRIAKNSTTVVCPVIDVIDDTTLEYHWRDSGGINVGGFDWNLQGSFGDVSERRALRRKLGCKSFKWYLENIYPELFIPGDAIGSGEIRNLGEGADTCLDSPARKADMHRPAGLYPCHRQGGNQYWMLSKAGEIRRDESCLDYSGADVILYPCHGSKGNQQWLYNDQTKQIRHGSSDKCLTMVETKHHLVMDECSKTLKRQKWLIENYDPTKG
ncbi:hypothetical protein HCN44_000175 [Aphidius gifuensis]|uniref:Polypeptide N-acetylgalactosaminyltransferase n=1 Tax=Aphidius gifuensis TaxID=684658 RepID=A0A834XRF8_APHGI|nr:hypothetical protein HCN44_000175 [Aphidius gifuensis]